MNIKHVRMKLIPLSSFWRWYIIVSGYLGIWYPGILLDALWIPYPAGSLTANKMLHPQAASKILQIRLSGHPNPVLLPFKCIDRRCYIIVSGYLGIWYPGILFNALSIPYPAGSHHGQQNAASTGRIEDTFWKISGHFDIIHPYIGPRIILYRLKSHLNSICIWVHYTLEWYPKRPNVVAVYDEALHQPLRILRYP